MPYCTQDDLLEQLPLSELIAMTDDDGFGAVSDAVVDRAIADAQTVIDAYCEQASYTVPFATVPDIIRRIAVDLAIDNLFTRRSVDKLPETRASRARNAMRFLEKVAAKEIRLGVSAPAPADSGQTAAASTPGDRLFTRDTLAGY